MTSDANKRLLHPAADKSNVCVSVVVVVDSVSTQLHSFTGIVTEKQTNKRKTSALVDRGPISRTAESFFFQIYSII